MAPASQWDPASQQIIDDRTECAGRLLGVPIRAHSPSASSRGLAWAEEWHDAVQRHRTDHRDRHRDHTVTHEPSRVVRSPASDVADAELLEKIRNIYRRSRNTYGVTCV